MVAVSGNLLITIGAETRPDGSTVVRFETVTAFMTPGTMTKLYHVWLIAHNVETLHVTSTSILLRLRYRT